MKMKWIKRTCVGMGAVACFAILAACSPVSGNGSLTSLDVNTSAQAAGTHSFSNVQKHATKDAKTVLNSGGPQLVFELEGQSGNINVNADTTNTLSVFVNGQQIATQQQMNGVYTVADPNAVANASVTVNVPANADLIVKENSGTINVTGATGQMDLEVVNGNITTSQVTLTGSSLLQAKNGTIVFVGAVDHFSYAHMHADQGYISAQFPASSSFHIDATTNAGYINTNFASSGTAIHADHGGTPRALIALDENAGSMNISIV